MPAEAPSDATLPAVTNWDGRLSCSPSEVVAVRSEADIVTAVAEAARRGVRIRASGGRFSYSPLALPDDGSVLLDTRGYAAVICVHADAPGGPSATVESGCTLRALQRVLWSHGLALATTTAFGDETVGGAVSVASHGSGGAVSSLSAELIRLRLVTASAEVVELSRAHDDFGAAAVSQTPTPYHPLFLFTREKKTPPYAPLFAGLARPARRHLAGHAARRPGVCPHA